MEIKDVLIQAGVEYNSALNRFCGNEALYTKYLFRLPDEKMMADSKVAFEAGEYKVAHDAVHTLKGVAANLSLPKLVDACQAFLDAVRAQNYEAAGPALVALDAKFDEICAVINSVK